MKLCLKLRTKLGEVYLYVTHTYFESQGFESYHGYKNMDACDGEWTTS